MLVADSHAPFRRALCLALKDVEAVDVVGEAGAMASVLKVLGASRVDVVLADARLAGLGSETARAGLASLLGQVAVVVVMGMTDAAELDGALRAAGAAGYWLKDGDVAELAGLVCGRGSADGRPRPSRLPLREV